MKTLKLIKTLCLVTFVFFTMNSLAHAQIHYGSNGNVGLGTTDPQAKLHINGDLLIGSHAKTEEVVAQGTGDLTISLGRYKIGTAIDIVAYISGNNAQDGGIYHIAGDWGNVLPKVVYRGESSISNRLKFYGYTDPTSNGYAFLFATWENQSSGKSYENTAYLRITSSGDFDTSNQGSFADAEELPNVLVARSDTGRVGIGTTNPSQKLHVKGGVAIEHGQVAGLTVKTTGLDMAEVGEGAYITGGGYPADPDWAAFSAGVKHDMGTFNARSTEASGVFLQNGNIHFRAATGLTDGANNISFPVRMRIEGDTGNVGIGTTNPSSKLHVAGPVLATQFNTSSDLRLKKNITTVDNALDKVAALRGVEFEWRRDEFSERGFDEGRKIGLIAQEVEKVVPQVVSTDGKGYKSVEYANLVAVLIEAVKELKVKCDNLQAQNEALQARIPN